MIDLKLAIFIVALSAISIFGFLAWFNTRGIEIKPKEAALICTKILQNNVHSDFKVTRYDFEKRYTFLDAKISLSVVYSNGNHASTDCIIKRNILNNVIKITSALIINEKGNFFMVDSLKIVYNK